MAQTQVRHVGDTEVAIAATLTRDAVAVDLTGLTIKFALFRDDTGAIKLVETPANITVTDVVNGKVQYNPQAADVDTAGMYRAYFIAIDPTGNRDTFPVAQADFKIDIQDN